MRVQHIDLGVRKELDAAGENTVSYTHLATFSDMEGGDDIVDGGGGGGGGMAADYARRRRRRAEAREWFLEMHGSMTMAELEMYMKQYEDGI